MHRISGVLLMVLSLSIAAHSAMAAPATKKHPNIILILTDDVGLGDIHCYGGPFNTPNIDKLASGGTQFTYCYATPLCGPSRCELLTGRYPFRTGLNSNQSKNAVSPKREVMIPTVMKEAGYVTASVGKWGQIAGGPGDWVGASTNIWCSRAAAGFGASKRRCTRSTASSASWPKANTCPT
jgi:arylsulfatase A